MAGVTLLNSGNPNVNLDVGAGGVVFISFRPMIQRVNHESTSEPVLLMHVYTDSSRTKLNE